VIVSDAKPTDDGNLVLKPIPPILNPKEEKPKFIYNRGEFFVKSNETK